MDCLSNSSRTFDMLSRSNIWDKYNKRRTCWSECLRSGRLHYSTSCRIDTECRSSMLGKHIDKHRSRLPQCLHFDKLCYNTGCRSDKCRLCSMPGKRNTAMPHRLQYRRSDRSRYNRPIESDNRCRCSKWDIDSSRRCYKRREYHHFGK